MFGGHPSTTQPIADAHTVVGIDWGKRIDQSICTLVDQSKERDEMNRVKRFDIKDWLIAKGSYDEQLDQIVKWLKEDVLYDEVVSESNGVGDGNTDHLIRAMKDIKGFSSNVAGLDANQKWNSEQAKTIARMCRNGTMTYNSDHPLAGVFRKDAVSLEYIMLDSDLIKVKASGKVNASDWHASLRCAIHKNESAYL